MFRILLVSYKWYILSPFKLFLSVLLLGMEQGVAHARKCSTTQLYPRPFCVETEPCCLELQILLSQPEYLKSQVPTTIGAGAGGQGLVCANHTCCSPPSARLQSLVPLNWQCDPLPCLSLAPRLPLSLTGTPGRLLSSPHPASSAAAGDRRCHLLGLAGCTLGALAHLPGVVLASY